MAVYLVLAAVTCGLACLVDKENIRQNDMFVSRGYYKNKTVYLMIFFLLFAISAGRIAVGGDYWRYTDIFNLLSQNRDKGVATEFGFNLMVKAIQHLIGADGKKYIAIFAVVAFVTIYFFMKALEELSDNYALSFFLFMVLGYYASSFNSIRNYLAFAVALYSVSCLFKKEYTKFVILVLIASTFHISILLILLAYPLGKIKWKPWVFAVLGAGCLFVLFFPGVCKSLVFMIYPQYEGTIYDTATISYTNIARCFGTIILSIPLYKRAIKGNDKYTFCFKMNIFATIVYCFCSFLPVVSRIGYYFNIFQILLIPRLIDSMPKKWMKIASTVGIIVLGIGYYVYFLNGSRYDNTRLVPYFNWVMN